jgi:hypothetical protein
MGKQLKKTRLSVDIDEEEYKYLKMCCVKLGMTIKDFVLKATIESVDSWEDIWMLDREDEKLLNKINKRKKEKTISHEKFWEKVDKPQ